MTEPQKFPFTLSDLLYWIVVHKDGTTIKYVYRDPIPLLKAEIGGNVTPLKRLGPAKTADTDPYWNPATSRSNNNSYSLGSLCDHVPDPDKPLWVSPDNKLSLSVGDHDGIKLAQDEFDYIIDCGDVLTPWTPSFFNSAQLAGDNRLIKLLAPYLLEPDKQQTNPHPYKLLKIKWFDRAAPPVNPEFWAKLYAELIQKGGDVATNCQGGHGRSGTAFCALMMMGSPDYGSLDAIIHLRALHCARAIEGVAQHEYLDQVAKFLGREANAAGMKEITSFKEAFDKSTKPTAIRMREWIKTQAATKAAPAKIVSANK